MALVRQHKARGAAPIPAAISFRQTGLSRVIMPKEIDSDISCGELSCTNASSPEQLVSEIAVIVLAHEALAKQRTRQSDET